MEIYESYKLRCSSYFIVDTLFRVSEEKHDDSIFDEMCRRHRRNDPLKHLT